MGISQIMSLLSGIALFLFGMSLMGDGLKKLSGSRLEPILFRLTGKPIRGVLLGTGVTAVIQSSCATSVMCVGFVNSGIMKLKQAAYVIFGAILGTSITGWIICLSYIEGAGSLRELLSTATLTGIIAIVGIGLRMFAKKRSFQQVGDILMGFAVLMFGMSMMSGAVGALGEQEWFTRALTGMKMPLLGILVGALFTALLQSASAAVGIVQALSVTGALTLESALPLLMGISIGAALPVLLSALGAKTDGKRTAFIYLVGSFMGVMVFASLFYIANAIFRFPFMEKTMNPFSLAAVNTLFRLVMLCLLLPFADVLVALVTLMIRDKKDAETDPALRLEERFLEYPALAVEQSRITIHEMAEQSRQAILSALTLVNDFSEEGFAAVQRMESAVDGYEDALGSYLLRVTSTALNEEQGQAVSIFLHTLSDLERISDHALNLAESAKELKEKQITFSESAQKEFRVIFDAVREVVQLTTDAFVTDNLETAAKIEPLEEVIDLLCDEMKLHHVERLQTANCTIRQGFVFNDLVTNLERVSDHCSNIAVAMIELNAGTFDTHEYLDRLKQHRTADYDRYFKDYRARFALE